MAERITSFGADEGVSRDNFNSRIVQMNSELDKIEKAVDSHTQTAGTITEGTFASTGVKAATGTDYTTARVRNIYTGTETITSLIDGDIYLLREA